MESRRQKHVCVGREKRVLRSMEKGMTSVSNLSLKSYVRFPDNRLKFCPQVKYNDGATRKGRFYSKNRSASNQRCFYSMRLQIAVRCFACNVSCFFAPPLGRKPKRKTFPIFCLPV